MINRLFRYSQLFWSSRYLLSLNLKKKHRWTTMNHYRGKPYIILPHVFHPALFFTTKLFVDYLNEKTLGRNKTVLEIGAGSGLASIFAAQFASKVVATDINPHAIRCARINTMINHLEHKIDIRKGDLFEPVKGMKFDVVLYSPPYFWKKPTNYIEFAFSSGDRGKRGHVLYEFIEQVGKYLKDDGKIIMNWASVAAIPNVIGEFEKEGFVLVKKKAFDVLCEIIYIYEFKKKK